MKFLARLIGALLTLALASRAQSLTPLCSTPYCAVTGSHLADASGAPVTGTISFQPTDAAGNPLSFHLTGQTISAAATATVSNGAFSLSLADSTQTTPANVCYRVSVTTGWGALVLGSSTADNSAPYQCVQMNPSWCSSTGCNFDNYLSNAALLSLANNVATTTRLGGVLVPTAGGLTIDSLGNLGVQWSLAPVQSVNGQTGAVSLSIPTNNNQLLNGAGYVTAAQAQAAAAIQAIQVNGQAQTPVSGVVSLTIPSAPIQSIQVNGQAQTPVGGTVNLTIPTPPVQAIQVNSNPQTPLNGVVNVTVPTNNNQLVNGNNYVNASQASAAAPVQSINGQTGNVNLTIPAAQVPADWNASTGVTQILNKPTIPNNNNQIGNGAGYVTASGAAAAAPVQSVNGQTGAVTLTIPAPQVQSDWNASTGPSAILNKPSVPTNNNQLLNGNNFVNAAGAAAAAPVQSVNGQTGAVSLTIPAPQVQVDWNASTGVSAILNKPSVPTNNNQLVNGNNFVNATQAAAAAPIQGVQVNGITQTPASGGVVNVAVPTNNNQIGNGAGYVTASGAAMAAPVQSVNGQTGAVTLAIPSAPVQSVNGQTGAVTLNIPAAQIPTDWNATSGVAAILNKPTVPNNNNQIGNGAGYVTAQGAAAAAPVQSVAARTGAVVLTHSDIADWTAATSGFASGSSSQTSATFATLTGQPADNANLAQALNAKQNALSFPLTPAQGGTGLTSVVGLVSGNTNACTMSGAWPNQTITCNLSSGGSGSGAGVPSGTLASIPSTCSVGTMYVATDQPAAAQLYLCSAANTWTPQLSLGPSGALQLVNGSLDIVPSQVPRTGATNLFTGTDTFSGIVNLTGQVNFTGATVTGLSTSGGSGSSSSSGAGVPSGALSAIPSTCAQGTMYVATDQPVGQQLYTCQGSNVWTQNLTLGGSGALQMTNGSLDIVVAQVPRTGATNTYTGLNDFSAGTMRLPQGASRPTCAAALEGMPWYTKGSATTSGVYAICQNQSGTYAWVNH